MNNPRHLLALVLCTALSTAGADALVNLVESSSLETSLNRLLSFVELRDTKGREREYSVPYLPEPVVKKYAADTIFNWKAYQDTVHWAQMVGLNNNLTSLGPPYDVYLTGCTLSPIGEAAAAIGQGLVGKTWLSATGEEKSVNFDPTADPSLQPPNHDKVNADFVLVPRVKSKNYCPGGRLSFFPDEGLLALVGIPGGGVNYEPGKLWCTPIGCVSDGSYPFPVWTNWTALANRMQSACNSVNKNAYIDYQKKTLASLGEHMPLAIHWNGATTITGTRSGTSMAPFYSLTTNLGDVAKLSGQDPLFAPYALAGLPMAAPGLTDSLDQLKRQLHAGNLQEQEIQGAATFLQTWQNFDTLIEARPLTYYAKSYFYTCGWFSCVPKPTILPMLMPPTDITATTCTTAKMGINRVPTYTGTSIFTTFRYHYGVTTTSEGAIVPNTVGTPVLRVDGE